MRTGTKSKLKILTVAALFLAPLATAWLVYGVFPNQAPAGRTHHGLLNDPARPLPEAGLEPAGGTVDLPVFDRRWTFLQVAEDNCAQACREGLATTRQVRALLHRRAARVQRVLVTDGPPPAPDAHPDLAVYRGGLALRETLGEHKAGTVYMVDPLGNWVLTYPAPAGADALFEDIKHLLKLSHIG
jgi:hypothetical protein